MISRIDYNPSVIWISPKGSTCLSDKLRVNITSPIAKSTSPSLLGMTFFARWVKCPHVLKIEWLEGIITKKRNLEFFVIPYNHNCFLPPISLLGFGVYLKVTHNFTGQYTRPLEVAGTFSEIPVMTGQKSYAFYSEKVCRYKNVHRDHLQGVWKFRSNFFFA